mmetsp:Transcript_63289/g.105300  ORF Transcript_63289/g.105300 Transcript_63289/m.105300 type:complete len:201 (+) Transcript_63289:962-1564(+)
MRCGIESHPSTRLNSLAGHVVGEACSMIKQYLERLTARSLAKTSVRGRRNPKPSSLKSLYMCASEPNTTRNANPLMSGGENFAITCRGSFSASPTTSVKWTNIKSLNSPAPSPMGSILHAVMNSSAASQPPKRNATVNHSGVKSGFCLGTMNGSFEPTGWKPGSRQSAAARDEASGLNGIIGDLNTLSTNVFMLSYPNAP